MRLLVDGDVLKYRCGYAAQRKIHHVYMEGVPTPLQTFRLKREAQKWIKTQPDPSVLHTDEQVIAEPASHAIHLVRLSIQAAVDRTNADVVQVYLSGDRNFREDIDPTYKANRPDEKPVHYWRIDKYLRNAWNADMLDTIEADDALGIEQCADVQNTCIATIDKDLDGIPGWHYNFMSMKHYWVTEDEAIRHFYVQLLTGDAIDNIIGLYRVGPATAKKMLADCETPRQMYERAVAAYTEAGRNIQDVVRNAKLLWILREPGVTWTPPE